MKIKIKMKKQDFYNSSLELKANNITSNDSYVLFETDAKTLDSLKRSRYEIEVIGKEKKIKKGHLISIVVSLFIFLGIIYVNSFRFSVINYNIETPLNEEITKRIYNNSKRLFCFDFININYDAFSKELREEYPMYPWINVIKKASKISVNIYEYDDNYPKEAVDTPGNIIASKDAIVDSYVIYNGSGNIHINQYVKKGDVLVSGIISSNSNEAVAAKAKILGYTYENYQMEIKKQSNNEILTGKREKYYELDLFSLDYKFNYKNLFTKYDSKSKTVFNLFDVMKVKEIEEYEKYDIMKAYNKDEAIEYAKSTILANFEANKKLTDEKIVDLKVVGFSEDDEKYYIQLLAKKYESITSFLKTE